MLNTSNGKVYKTKHYNLFSFIDGNRNINKAHLKRIELSLSRKQLPVPIIVDEGYKIFDGQHRYEACKKIGLPIYYLIIPNLSLSDVQVINANMKNWTTDDYCDSYCKIGKNKDYFKYREYKERFGFGHNETLVLLNGSGKNEHESRGLWQNFRDGKFKILNYSVSIKNAEKILMTAPYYDGYKRRSYVFALLHCFNQEGYNHQTFLRKLKFQSSKMLDQTTVKNHLIMIERVYNFKSSKKNTIRLFTN